MIDSSATAQFGGAPTDSGPGAPPRESLGIAIVTYRSTSTLPACLESIGRHSPDAVVVLVENSDEVEAMAALAAAAEPLSVEVIDPGGNVGYARGVNLAAERLAARGCSHLLILNPDVALTTNPLGLVPLLARVDVVSGVLQPSQASRRASSAEHFAGNVKKAVTVRRSVLQALVGTRFNSISGVPPGEFLFVAHVDGAYMFQRIDYYLENRFDESFELYFEDAEYCDRANAGRGVGVVGLPVGIHEGGASAAKSESSAYIVNRVSHARYLRRKYPHLRRIWLQFPFHLEVLARTLTRQPEGLATRLEAHRLAVTELRGPGGVKVLGSPEPGVGHRTGS